MRTDGQENVHNFMLFYFFFLVYIGLCDTKEAIGTASANSVEFSGIRPRMYLEDLL